MGVVQNESKVVSLAVFCWRFFVGSFFSIQQWTIFHLWVNQFSAASEFFFVLQVNQNFHKQTKTFMSNQNCLLVPEKQFACKSKISSLESKMVHHQTEKNHSRKNHPRKNHQQTPFTFILHMFFVYTNV